MANERQSINNLCLPWRVAVRPLLHPFHNHCHCPETMEVLVAEIHHKLGLHIG